MASNTGHQTYYVPESSKYPLMASMSLGLIVLGASTTLNNLKADSDASGSAWLLAAGILALISVLSSWFGTAIREHRKGLNSAQLKQSYVIGMQWFIFSEVMFFAAFFGSLFYVRVLAGPWLGESFTGELLWPNFVFDWPTTATPQEAVLAYGGQQVMAVTGTYTAPREVISWSGIPLINTLLLLSSSVTVHFAHHALKAGHKKPFHAWLFLTLILGFVFVGFQAYEYYAAYSHYGLTLKSGAYGSTFFMLTGFHGFHVCLGAVMLTVMFLRSYFAGHFTADDHFGFEAASWYWHFVDVVWVGLFLFVYVF